MFACCSPHSISSVWASFPSDSSRADQSAQCKHREGEEIKEEEEAEINLLLWVSDALMTKVKDGVMSRTAKESFCFVAALSQLFCLFYFLKVILYFSLLSDWDKCENMKTFSAKPVTHWSCWKRLHSLWVSHRKSVAHKGPKCPRKPQIKTQTGAETVNWNILIYFMPALISPVFTDVYVQNLVYDECHMVSHDWRHSCMLIGQLRTLKPLLNCSLSLWTSSKSGEFFAAFYSFCL